MLFDNKNIDWSVYSGYINYIPNVVYNTIMDVHNQTLLVVTGNRFGKTRGITRKIAAAVLGQCKFRSHNINPEDECRVIRLAAALLPNDKEHEVRNTIYPALKSQLPKNLIRKDITARDATITVNPLLGGAPAQLEFVSYGQDDSTQAGVSRKMIYMDEVAPYAFYEESVPRLATTYGQLIIGTTPVEAGWMYTEIYERARVYYRTKAVRDFMLKDMGVKVGTVEKTDSIQDIAVIQAASDDNPIFQILVDTKKKEVKDGIIKPEEFPYDNVTEYLDSRFMYEDKDTLAMRRYGIFKQITGAVHKEFNWNIHMIPEGKYFPNGISHDWIHARMIDYHQSVPWAITWIVMSPDNEAFVYNEMNPDPHTWTTLGICKEIANRSRDYKFIANLIDPLSNHKQVNTNTSCMEDMNRIFREMKKEGYGTGGYWEGWDTKGTKGEDAVRERLINSKICGRPFNNLQKIDGKEERLPTLWILDHCKEVGLSLKNWKMEQWVDRSAQVTKDPKDKTEMKFSHFNMCLEAIFKDSRFRGRAHVYQTCGREYDRKQFFQGRA